MNVRARTRAVQIGAHSRKALCRATAAAARLAIPSQSRASISSFGASHAPPTATTFGWASQTSRSSSATPPVGMKRACGNGAAKARSVAGPPIVAPGTILGPMLGSVCDAVGLRSAPPIIAGATHDTGAAIAAIPGLDPQSVYISSGTWSLMGMELPAPVLSAAARSVNFTNEGGINGTIRLLKNIAGLWLLQECRRSWQRQGQSYTWEELMALASNATPFVSIVNPDAAAFLNPDDMPSAIQFYCALHGITVPQTPGAIVRCCLESLALRYRTVLDTLRDLTGQDIDTIRIVGGGSQNQLLNRFSADACNLPVVAGPVEATALGNVLIQALTIGAIPDLATGRRIIAESFPPTVIEPSTDRAAWDAHLAGFVRLPR